MTEPQKKDILINALFSAKYVKIFPHSRGVSGALYLQSAIAGVLFCLGYIFVKLPFVSDVDVWVLRNRNSRIVSGQE